MDPLDSALLTGAQRRRQLIEAGVSDHQLRGPLWIRTARGKYAWAANDPVDVEHRIRVGAARLPEGAGVGGWAAAWLHGDRDQDGARADGQPIPVPLCLGPDHHLRGGVPVRVSRSRLVAGDVELVAGVPCTSVTRTGFDLARTARDLHDAVADVDALLRVTDLDLRDLTSYAGERRRWHGVRRVLDTAGLASPQSLSRAESRLRVIWVVDAGLPRPLVNARVADRRTGRIVAMADLLDEEAALDVEFDGAVHAGSAQRGDDDRRTQSLHRLGLHVVRYTAESLQPSRRRSTVHSMRAVRARRLDQVDGRRRLWVVVRG